MRKKVDEMDKNIKQRAEALGFKVAMLLMAIWTFYESYIALSTGQLLNIVPCLVLTAICSTEGIYELVLKRKMIKGDDEYHEPNKLLIAIIAIIAIAAVVASIGSYIVLRFN